MQYFSHLLLLAHVLGIVKAIPFPQKTSYSNTDGNISEIPNVFSPGISAPTVDSSGHVIPPKAKERALVEKRIANPYPFDGEYSVPGDNVAVPPPGTNLVPIATPGTIVCNPYQNSYKKCWHDVNALTVGVVSGDWISTFYDRNMTSADQNQTLLFHSGVTYFFNIEWIPGCSAFSSQPIRFPTGVQIGSGSAQQQFINTYYQCTGNQGLGGYVDVGCLRFGFFPNNIRGIEDKQGDHPELYWKANGNFCG